MPTGGTFKDIFLKRKKYNFTNFISNIFFMTIKQILDVARIEAGADNNDVKDETLLQILNENIKEILEIIQTKKFDEFFAVSILNDLIPEQYKYWELEYEDDNWNNLKVRKILKVRVDWKNITRVDVLDMDEEKIQNLSEPVYWISGQDLYVFHKQKEVLVDWIEVIWLTDVPEIQLNTPLEKIFLWKIKVEKRILKLSLKSFLYERMLNFSMAQNSRIFYEKEMENFINRLWKVKEPISREIPDLSYYS